MDIRHNTIYLMNSEGHLEIPKSELGKSRLDFLSVFPVGVLYFHEDGNMACTFSSISSKFAMATAME